MQSTTSRILIAQISQNFQVETKSSCSENLLLKKLPTLGIDSFLLLGIRPLVREYLLVFISSTVKFQLSQEVERQKLKVPMHIKE